MKTRITVRGTGVELRGVIPADFEVLTAFSEAMKPFGLVIASMESDDYDPFPPEEDPMSKPLTIVATLTEAQYDMLRAAVVALQTGFEQDGPGDMGYKPSDPATLERAWDRIATAWQRSKDGF